jgi:hypothetical protein
MVHPVVRPDRNEALKLVQHFNEQLRLEGWNLMEEEKIACGALPLRRKALDDGPDVEIRRPPHGSRWR